jgi:hypothetical protein
MNNLSLISLFTLSFWSFTSYGQLVRDHDVDESTINPWIEDSISKYSDRYIFQPNDGNFLILIVDDTNVTAQIHYPAHWTEGGYALESGIADSSEVDTHSEYVTLTGVKISEGKFYSDQYKAEFITFESDTIYQGIKVHDSWSIWAGYKYEIGVKRQENLMNIYKGEYPEASLTVLDSAYVTSLSKYELKIMRNEIYARYNYRFKEGGELAKYFSQQDWYTNSTGGYKSVQHMLTWIELRNIELIKRIEKIK